MTSSVPFDSGRLSLFLRTLPDAAGRPGLVPWSLASRSWIDTPQPAGGELAVRRWQLGDVLNERYTVVDVLGEGGMGLVCRVQDALHPGRDLALKTLSPSVVDASRAQLLRAEFQTMSELSHPNIARVWDFERIAGTDTYCFTMEFLEGRHLVAAADGAPLEGILDWVVEACRALQYLHSRGVTHADFKPQNVVVTPAGHAKVLDFGLSAAGNAGLLLGTPAYMAPELGTGVAPDARVDLYALGVTMFQLIYGRLPFSGQNVLERPRAAREQAAPPAGRRSLRDGRPPRHHGEALRQATRGSVRNRGGGHRGARRRDRTRVRARDGGDAAELPLQRAARGA